MFFGLSIYGFFLIIAIIIMIILVLPIPLFRLSSYWINSFLDSRLDVQIFAGIFMGLYILGVSSLAIPYLSGGGNLLSYWDGRQILQVASFIAGAASGVLLQTGIRLKTTRDIILFICGLAVLLVFALFAAFLTIAPE